MKTLQLAGVLLASAWFASRSLAQTAPLSPNQLALVSAVKNEDQIVSNAHDAALQDEDTVVDSDLATAPSALLQAPGSVLLTRRAAAVCVWLLYDQDSARAIKLANRVINELGSMPVETDSMARFERLYWEAWLRAEVLGDKTTALKLIAEAEPLKPDDPRIAWSEKIWGAGS